MTTCEWTKDCTNPAIEELPGRAPWKGPSFNIIALYEETPICADCMQELEELQKWLDRRARDKENAMHDYADVFAELKETFDFTDTAVAQVIDYAVRAVGGDAPRPSRPVTTPARRRALQHAKELQKASQGPLGATMEHRLKVVSHVTLKAPGDRGDYRETLREAAEVLYFSRGRIARLVGRGHDHVAHLLDD